MCQKRNKNKRAFTMVELLIAASIFSVVAIAIYSTFDSGTSVLRRIKDNEFLQEKILIKAEGICRQLREQPASKKQLFSGTNSKISLAANINFEPCRITYYFENGSIMRATEKFAQVLTKSGQVDPDIKVKPGIFLSGIENLKFSYLFLNLSKNQYNWVDAWQQDFLPQAVRLIITAKNQDYVWIIFLPKT